MEENHLKEIALRSSNKAGTVTESDVCHEFLLPGSICAIATDSKSLYTVLFIQIQREEVGLTKIVDDYNHIVAARQHYINGCYLERINTT